jgi:hypothetical protein
VTETENRHLLRRSGCRQPSEIFDEGKWSVPLAAGACARIPVLFTWSQQTTNLQKCSPTQHAPVAFNCENFYWPYPAKY